MNYWTLIDREEDPHEVHNAYDNPAYAKTRKTLHAELQRLRTELQVPAEDPLGSAPPNRGVVKPTPKP